MRFYHSLAKAIALHIRWRSPRREGSARAALPEARIQIGYEGLDKSLPGPLVQFASPGHVQIDAREYGGKARGACCRSPYYIQRALPKCPCRATMCDGPEESVAKLGRERLKLPWSSAPRFPTRSLMPRVVQARGFAAAAWGRSVEARCTTTS
jgi:hypothetical protein